MLQGVGFPWAAAVDATDIAAYRSSFDIHPPEFPPGLLVVRAVVDRNR
jgi:hypothetical protein